MAKLFGIDFIPFNVPLRRRLQTVSVLYFIVFFAVSPFLSLWLMYRLFFSNYWYLTLLYAIWYVYDYNTPEQGSRPMHIMKNLFIWRWFRDYFPITLEKTTELDPQKNYVFGYHPHGIFSVGAFTNFGTESTDFRGKFPGINPHLVTLNQQFYFPIRREMFEFGGAIASSKKSIENVIKGKGRGEAAVIVIGGAQEVLNAYPGRFDLYLSRRKGFVKLALKHGANLVPVFSFGENDLYNQMAAPDGSVYKTMQEWIKHLFGYLLPLIYGRGIFNYSLGFMPYRHPINTIVGSPIDVGNAEINPSQEAIDHLHAKYVDGLKEIFETNKKRHGIDDDVHLNIL